MIIKFDQLDGLPVTSNPIAIAMIAGFLRMEADIASAPSAEIAQNAKEALNALKKSFMETTALDGDAYLTFKAITIVEEGGLPAGKKPKIKDSWKTFVEPKMRSLGFSGKEGLYERSRDGAKQIVELQRYKDGGSFVINLTLQPLALVTSDADLVSVANSSIQARWLYDQKFNRTDFWWVSGYNAETMDRAATAAAEFLERNVETAFSELTCLVFSREKAESDAKAAIIFSNLDQVRQKLADYTE